MMGGISFSASMLITILLVVSVIAIFPENLCLPFTTTCVFLTPLHYLKNLLYYFGLVFFYFAMIVSFGIFIGKTINFFKENRLVIDLINFLLSFDEKSYNKLSRTIKGGR
jgi:hypothetical protein